MLPPVDPRLEAFLSSSAPDVFRHVLGGEDVWRADPLDVVEIHQDARAAFDLLLSRNAGALGSVSSRLEDRILLVKGDSGSGKTHLMRAFRSTAMRAGAFFTYMQLTTGIEDYTQYVLLKVLDSLQRPHDVDFSQESSLSRLSQGILQEAIIAELPGIDPEGQLVSPEEVANGLERLHRFEQVPSDVLLALLRLQLRDPAITKRVLKYLRGERLSEFDSRLLGGIGSREGPDRFAGVIEALAVIVRELYDMPLAICIDQLEDSYETGDDAPRRFGSALSNLRALTETGNTVVVISSLTDFYAAVRGMLSLPLTDRLESGLAPVTLRSSANENEVRALLGCRLRYLFESVEARYDEREPLYPFDENVASSLAGLRIRTIVRVAAEARERSFASGKPPSIERPAVLETLREQPVSPDVVNLEQAWNDFQSTFTATLPEDSRSVGELLARALQVVGPEVAPARVVSVEACTDGWVMYLTREGAIETALMAVANERSQFGHLGKAVERIGGRASARGLAAIVVRNDEFPKGTKTKFAQIHGALVKQGGRTVVLRENELHAILAYFAFIELHAKRPQFEAWRTEALPLSSLPGIAELLRIEGGPEPPPRRNGKPSVVTEVPPCIEKPAETAPTQTAAPKLSDPIELGRLANDCPLTLSAHDLIRHAAILGGAGSGKTTLAFNLIEQLLARGVAAVLVDRKGDLAAFADPSAWHREVDEDTARRRRWLRDRLDVRLYTPGAPEGRDLSIPTLPADLDGLSAADSEQEVRDAADGLAAMLEWGTAKNNRLAILRQSITTLGSLRSGGRTNIATLVEFISEAPPELLAAIGKLDRKLLDRVVEDLETLRINQGRLLDGTAATLDVDGMLDAARSPAGKVPLTIISTKFLGAVLTQQFWIARLLSEIYRYASRNPRPTLQAILFMDEADLYLPAIAKPATKGPLENLIRRGRSAGIGVFLATQSPGDLDYKSRENITTWLAGRVNVKLAIEKLRPIFGERGRLADELPALKVGNFYCVDEHGARRFNAALPCIMPVQLDERQILELARASSPNQER